MSLPPYKPGQSMRLPTGRYIFKVADEPVEKKDSNGNPYLIFTFNVIAKNEKSIRYRNIFFPNELRYNQLLNSLEAIDGNGNICKSGDEIVGMEH